MTRLGSVLRVLIGAAAGVGSALVAVVLSDVAGFAAPFAVIPVLAVALVGFGVGSLASLVTYGTAGLVISLLVILPDDGAPMVLRDVVQLASFVIGAPFVVLLAMRADRQRWEVGRARDASAIAERQAERLREVAEGARQRLSGALDAAEHERRRLAEVAEAIPEPLIVYDADAAGTYANRAALRLFGRSFFDRSVDDWARNAEPRDEQGNPLPREAWPQVLGQTSPVRRRIVVRLPMSGRDVLVAVDGTPIAGGGCVLLLRDVGKEEDERRRLARFASFVAHELRNPLAVAKARIELAQRDPGLPTRARTHGTRALESVGAAIGILERLELYSRADAGGIEADRRPFDVAAAIDAAIERLRARGSERDVRCELPQGPIMALGDVHFAEQAIANLLTNADRYAADGTPIAIDVEASDPITVRVSDAGPGISDEIAERLFHDRVAVGRGLGLGLYLVHATMVAQGGSVLLEQRRPRAVFALRWPAAQPRSAHQPAEETPAEVSAGS
jgi:signal transduction histidine kinase